MSSLDKDNQPYRSQEDLNSSNEFERFEKQEFQESAAFLDTPVSRRKFIKLMGATAALAGVSGCSFNFRKPVQFVYPYAKNPPIDKAYEDRYFATSMALGDQVTGLLAKSYEGRPVKIEGNPDHSQSLGATSVFHQASLLELYDPDRLSEPKLNQKFSSLVEFKDFLKKLSLKKSSDLGEGLCLVFDTQLSPTFFTLIRRFKKKYPKASIYYLPSQVYDNERFGINAVTNDWLKTQINFDKANLIVSFDKDFLGTESTVRSEKCFAKSRDPEENNGQMSRLYSVETSLTITGSKSDHRRAMKRSEIPYFVLSLCNQLQEKGLINLSSTLKKQVESLSSSYESALDSEFFKALVSDIVKSSGKCVFVAGRHMPDYVHSLVYLLNRNFSSSKIVEYRRDKLTAEFSFLQKSYLSSIKSFDRLLRTGSIDTLVLLGGNIVEQAPADVDLSSAFKFVESKIHLSAHKNLTSSLCSWVVPQSHFLESWGDLESVDGVKSIVQPVIRPLHESLSDLDFMALLVDSRKSAFQHVKLQQGIKSTSSKKWKKYLHEGVVNPPSRSIQTSFFSRNLIKKLSSLPGYIKRDFLEISFQDLTMLYDGRFANNGWLQELPDPITKLTWDNAALIGVQTAKKFSLSTGDMVHIRCSQYDVKVPVFVLPGHCEYTITLPLGYGREIVGRVGDNKGFKLEVMRTFDDFTYIPKATLVKLTEVYKLASTQDHGSMEERPFIRSASLSHYVKHPDFAKKMEHVPSPGSLWGERKYDKGNQWGMSIDLSRCTGCSVCVVACQAENNIPIVGKDEILNGREMHWIRIDRYFDGKGDEAKASHQPTTCLHCENAPCEQVCPVAATVHGEEGTNDMVYNRCVGTRYCADNCPVKVRRFNFFDYHQRNPQSQPKKRIHFFDYMREPDPSIQKMFNPEVTIRMRGVMEKCTFCIQRIMQGKSDSENDKRKIIDGEVKTACQQACPSDAIAFGNILDENSQVKRRKNRDRDYEILSGLHLKSRLTYSALITNPSSELVAETEKEHHVQSKH